jgi:hypothetical protein
MQASTDEPPFGGVGGTPSTSAQTAPPVLTLVPPPGPPSTQADAATAGAAQPAFKKSSLSDRIGHSKPVSKIVQDSTIESIKAALEKRNRMFLVIALEGARRAVVEGDELVVEFAPDAKHLRDNLSKPESIKVLREAARETLGHDIGVHIVIKDKDDPDEPLTKEQTARLEKQRLRQLAEQDPTVQKVLRKFRAEIVDVWQEKQNPEEKKIRSAKEPNL